MGTQNEDPRPPKEVVVILVLLAALGFAICLLILSTSGCVTPAKANRDDDMSVSVTEVAADDYFSDRPPSWCRGTEDEGKVTYWMGPPYELSVRYRGAGTRYICVDHGKEHDGWWWEARPESREIP